jgi:hypothetical protein
LYSLSEAVRLKRIFEIRREFNQQFKQHKLKSDKGTKQQIIEIRKQKQLEDKPKVKHKQQKHFEAMQKKQNQA